MNQHKKIIDHVLTKLGDIVYKEGQVGVLFFDRPGVTQTDITFAEKPSMPPNKELRILIVEDDAINRKLLTSILKTIGFTNVTEAENGKIAWNLIQQQPIDLVMTDWMMPEMDGLELLQKIRNSNTKHKNLPVVMITALGRQDDIVKAASLEINGYIVKPFSMKTILAKIDEIFV